MSGDLGVTVCGLAMLGGVVGFTSRGGDVGKNIV